MARLDYVVKVEDLRVWFPTARSFIDLLTGKSMRYVHAVDGVSFFVREGETYCLVGESGCGKTTTGRTVIRLTPPENVVGGRVLFRPSSSVYEYIASHAPEAVVEEEKAVDVYRVPSKHLRLLRREMQIIFQDPFGSLDPRLRVREILEEPLVIHGIELSSEERLEKILNILKLLKLTPPEEFIERYPHQLSGGQRQRVAIARALILNPRFIIADEPVSMLDVSIRAEVLEVLEDLRNKFRLAQVFITHDLALARYVCNRVGVMYLGRIVEEGPVDRVIENPLHPYTKALIAAIPEPNPENRRKLRELRIKGEVPSALNIPKGCRFRPRCIAYEENEWVRGKCEATEPELVEVEPEHRVACWLYRKA